jgi:hypothetical protein
MKNKLFIAILMVCSLASVAVYGAWAQAESTLGVKAGDNFTYSFEAFWSSTDPNQIVPQEFSNLNQTLSIHFNVTDASETIAYLNVTTFKRDGTQVVVPSLISVSSGRGEQTAFPFIIGANLTSGDQVYPQSDPKAVEAKAAAAPFTINDTLSKTYLGTARPVNQYTESSGNATSGDQEQKDLYYDQATGVLLEMTLRYTSTTSGESDSEHWKITQFNSAVGPSDGTDGTNPTGSLPDWILYAIIVVVVVIIVVLVTMLVLRGRKKPDVQEPEPLPAETQPPS